MERCLESNLSFDHLLQSKSEPPANEIWIGHKNDTSEKVCIKKIYFTSAQEATLVLQECFAMISLIHENIIKLRSCLVSNSSNVSNLTIQSHESSYIINSILLVMEYFPEGDLGNLILYRKNKIHLPWTEEELLEYARQLLSGFSYMQSLNIAHRDIKPQNIFVSNQGKVLKIGDFGSTTIAQREEYSIAGTPTYLSPALREGFSDQIKSGNVGIRHNVYKSDVWSLGLVLVYMTTLEQNKSLQSLNNLQQSIDELFETFPYNYRKIKSILMKMLVVEECNRLDFLELKDFLDEIMNKPPMSLCIGCNEEKENSMFYDFDNQKMCKMCVDLLDPFPGDSNL